MIAVFTDTSALVSLIKTAFTFDEHFKQMGFKLLFPLAP